jgi:hypothetical protein
MPWRGPQVAGEFPTLGDQVADWIEANCVIPDGDRVGEQFILTREMLMFLYWFYRLTPVGRWHFPRGGQLMRSQKWGKGPFSAAIVCAEASPDGPVLFDGWNADGEPVGRPWSTPHIQITAVSEDQTDNVWRALQPMIELGSLKGDIPDTGQTRINLPGGGLIEPVTASARSRLGQRITFALEDETHSWLPTNGGQKLADTQRRNLAGMGGRFLETTNAYDPAELSVAQRTAEKPIGVHIDNASPPAGSVRNKKERRKVMRAVYGDSLKSRGGWVDLDRIDLEVEALLEHDPAQAERFFLNRIHAGEGTAFDVDKWAARVDATRVVDKRDLIVIGVDGARYDDALAIVATDVVTGHQWPLAVLERPADADDSYEHDFDAADGAMIEAFRDYEVWRVYIDPQHIERLLERWSARWSEKVVIEWFTNRPRQICYAVRGFVSAVDAGDMSHNGDAAFARHIGNAKKKLTNVHDDEGRPMWSLQKDRPKSRNKIDAAMAAVLSWEARCDALVEGAKKSAPRSKMIRSKW